MNDYKSKLHFWSLISQKKRRYFDFSHFQGLNAKLCKRQIQFGEKFMFATYVRMDKARPETKGILCSYIYV